MSNPFAASEFQPSTMTRTTVRLKRVGVMSAGIFMGTASALLGLLMGGFIFLLSLVGIGAGGPGGPANPAAALIGLGFAAVIALPVFYGIAGFIGGAFYAFVYNIISGMTGGLEMEIGSDR